MRYGATSVPVRIDRADPEWPGGLARLGAESPAFLDTIGDRMLLRRPAVALFCSETVPGRAVIQSYDLAVALAETGATVIGGFQSPIERDVLAVLLAGRSNVIACPARTLHRKSLTAAIGTGIERGRLLLASPFPHRLRRATAASAGFRNRVAAALSEGVVILHATAGGRLMRLAAETSRWGVPLHCLEHPRNEDLRLLGARPLSLNGVSDMLPSR